MDVNALAAKITAGDRGALAQGITLVESHKTTDWEKAKELLVLLKGKSPARSRIGFSGPPGVGKSSLIEKMGMALIKEEYKVAVLAVDPSSEISGGSILGDKTRMEELSRDPMAFVRPSPTRGHLGGVTSSLPGVILLCEAAGYEWILVESVGVGQSEIELSRMVDLFVLVAQPGGGDELQGIKKGILEYVDLVLVNKVDRDPQLVNLARQQLLAALKILRQSTPPVLPCSALTGQGVGEALMALKNLLVQTSDAQGEDFNRFWFYSLLVSEYQKYLKTNPRAQSLISQYEQELQNSDKLPVELVDQFIQDLGLKPSS